MLKAGFLSYSRIGGCGGGGVSCLDVCFNLFRFSSPFFLILFFTSICKPFGYGSNFF